MEIEYIPPHKLLTMEVTSSMSAKIGPLNYGLFYGEIVCAIAIDSLGPDIALYGLPPGSLATVAMASWQLPSNLWTRGCLLYDIIDWRNAYCGV